MLTHLHFSSTTSLAWWQICLKTQNADNCHHRSVTHTHEQIRSWVKHKILTPFCPVETCSEVSALMLRNNFQRNFSVCCFAVAFPPPEIDLRQLLNLYGLCFLICKMKDLGEFNKIFQSVKVNSFTPPSFYFNDY